MHSRIIKKCHIVHNGFSQEITRLSNTHIILCVHNSRRVVFRLEAVRVTTTWKWFFMVERKMKWYNVIERTNNIPKISFKV